METPLNIPEFAKPRLADFFRPPGSFAGELAVWDGLFENGRNAVYWAFQRLDLTPGGLVWMPAFHGGWEVQPLLDLGLDIAWYPVREDLSIDEDFLMRRLAEWPGAVYLIHYYGQAQPCTERLAAYCAKRRLPLVEDCAYALFSRHAGRELGTFGVMGIYSFAKSIPIASGGALRVDKEAFQALTRKPFKPILRLAPSWNYYRDALKALVRSIVGPRVTGWIRSWRGTQEEAAPTCSHLKGLKGSPESRYRKIYRHGLSLPSRRLAGRTDVEDVVKLRRAHWLKLHERLSAWPGYRNVFTELAPGDLGARAHGIDGPAQGAWHRRVRLRRVRTSHIQGRQ